MDTPLDTPLVSVIIPAYNAERYLEETVASVLAQTYQQIELILVNDGSRDGTAALLDQLAATYPNIRCIHKENTGVSDTRNHGLATASGTLVAFLDADDVWLAENISKKVALLADYDAVYSNCAIIDDDSRTTGKEMTGENAPSLDDFFSFRSNYFTAPSGIVFRKSVLDTIGGFDTGLSNNADQDIWIRTLAAGFRIGHIPEVLWLYRVHAANMSGNIALLEKDTLYLYSKAERAGMFASRAIRRKAFAKMYRMLAGSWWGQGNNKLRGLRFRIRAFLTWPV